MHLLLFCEPRGSVMQACRHGTSDDWVVMQWGQSDRGLMGGNI